MTTTPTAPPSVDDVTDAMVERIFNAAIGALELFSIHIGWRLGLYRALHDAGPCNAGELADRAGIDPRYAREWLEQQAVAGFLDVVTTEDEEGADAAEERHFGVPAAHVEIFCEPESLAHVAPFGPMIAGIGGTLAEVVEAYRTGSGVPYSHYGTDFRDGQGGINRPAFVNELPVWLAAIASVDERLRADPAARVADIGCGQGYSTIAIAAAYPDAEVTGFDVDEPSVTDARSRAAAANVDVQFEVSDAASLSGSGPFDLICIFEALHDMAAPVAALEAAGRALAPGGHVLVMDERVAERFTAPGDEVERMMYGWSVVHCLPASRCEHPSAALGTALRADTVLALADQAGLSHAEILPIDNDFFRFYLMRP
jgi:2-polyprenyl-3-methyl-5-hydroxy-6-metoxy-1,4-benzoquinol methylase